MPVLYAAVARRLGYPVYLVSAKDHLFVRWQETGSTEHVNIEGTNHGISIYSDDNYKKWRALTAEDTNSGVHMKSMTPAQDVALFLMTRGGALQYHKRLPEAAVAYAHAALLWPEHRDIKIYLAETGVKLAPWLFHESSPSSFASPPVNLSPAEAIEATNRNMLKQLYPGTDWDAVYRDHFNHIAK